MLTDTANKDSTTPLLTAVEKALSPQQNLVAAAERLQSEASAAQARATQASAELKSMLARQADLTAAMRNAEQDLANVRILASQVRVDVQNLESQALMTAWNAYAYSEQRSVIYQTLLIVRAMLEDFPRVEKHYLEKVESAAEALAVHNSAN